MDQTLRKMTLELLGQGRHKTSAGEFLGVGDGVLLDVRAMEEVETMRFGLEHHKNLTVLNIPIDQLPDRLGELPEGKPLAIFCSSVVRAAIAYAFLLSKGLTDVRIVEGGCAAMADALKPGKVLKALRAGR